MLFRKKPVVVDAKQWFPGTPIEGVEERKPELIFSASGDYYYLSSLGRGGFRADAWLAVEPGSEMVKKHGDVLPFAFFEVKSGERKQPKDYPQLTQRYLDHIKAERIGETYGLIETLEGRMTVNAGDWIITGVKGEKYPCEPAIFAATYRKLYPAIFEAIEARRIP